MTLNDLGGMMLEICISVFLLTSLAISIVLWRALAVAKRADAEFKG